MLRSGNHSDPGSSSLTGHSGGRRQAAPARPSVPSRNQPSDRPARYQSARQPVRPSAGLSFSQPAHQPACSSSRPPIGWLARQPASSSTSQPIDRPAHRPACSSTVQLVDRLTRSPAPSTGLPIDRTAHRRARQGPTAKGAARRVGSARRAGSARRDGSVRLRGPVPPGVAGTSRRPGSSTPPHPTSLRQAHRTPRGRNWMLIRGPTPLAVFGIACSHVRWQEPPMTIRSPWPRG